MRTFKVLIFKGFKIPAGTKFEIIEVVEDNDLKVYFHHGDNEECIQIMTLEEVNNL
jgi:hypothetical protein